ncbi:hypothetical protein F5972_27225 [Microbispora cellulosiformans]|uniref:Uncharacterized protein n=1 Tax=Microbispora cellulosiformans TaxID=2614688 RepID=A0A5J5JVV2_9ACTN|nr:hypothetical protein [Microbispora cellulosiformans]KAA9375452.1 hypothetical protein F5972_27225 [Microbispora cellulosiformans]
MSSGRTTLTAYFAAFCGLIFVGLFVFAPRPLWLGFLVVVLLAALWLGVVKGLLKPRELPYSSSPPPVTVTERVEPNIADVALPSAWADYDFVFSATVRWSPIVARFDESLANPEALAIDAILERARAITANRPPGRASLVRHELSGALARMEPDATGGIRAMAHSVTLTLADQDQARLAKLAAARKENALWEHEMRYEQTRRAYLSESVLKDTGSAVVWWLAKNDDHVQKTVQDIGLLAQLSSAANNTHVAEPFRHLLSTFADGTVEAPAGYVSNGATGAFAPSSRTVPDLFGDFLSAMDIEQDSPERVLLAKHVADVLRAYGRQEAADDLLRRFDPAESPRFDGFEPPSEPPDDGPDQ